MLWASSVAIINVQCMYLCVHVRCICVCMCVCVYCACVCARSQGIPQEWYIQRSF